MRGFRTLLLCVAVLTPAAVRAASPAILSGSIVTPSVNVHTAPATPLVNFSISAPAGLAMLSATFSSPSGQGFTETYLATVPVVTTGTVGVQPVDNPLPFGAEPGTWTLEAISITDGAGVIQSYTGPALAALFPSRSLLVVNANGAQTAAPVITAGSILTPTVKLGSASPYFEADLTVTDAAGVKSAAISLLSPDGKLVIADAYGATAVTNGKIEAAVKLTSSSGATGTWRVIGCEALDVAENVDAPANCAGLFPSATFQVTP